MKKIGLIFVLVLSLMISLVGCGNDNGKDDQHVKANPVTDFEYKVTVMDRLGECVIINGYTGESKDVVIPEKIEGYPVKIIGFNAFINDDIISVILPDTIEMIRENAFTACYNLHTVDFGSPKSLVIQREAFANCSSLKKVILPSGVTEIGSKAFYACESVEEIYIPNTVTKWGEATFNMNKSLTKITFEEGLAQIGGSVGAFVGADLLTSVTIPASVKKIRLAAFNDCDSLKNITFLGDAPMELGSNALGEPNKDVKIYYKKGTAGWDTTSLKADYTLVEYQ